MKGRGGTFAGILLVAMLVTTEAFAFCRTRTVPGTPSYNPTSGSGCLTEGQPLFWRNSCIGYSIQKDNSIRISADQAARLMSIAFTRWTGATCALDPATERTRPSIDVRFLGQVECGRVEYISGTANQNVIVFRDYDWPLKKEDGVLGLTTVKFTAQTGEIFGADIEFNTRDMFPINTEEREPEDTEFDFLSVATHEAGHFLGLAHADVPGTTMYASYLPGQSSIRNLAPDDILGVCDVYRPDGTRAVLNEKQRAADECNPTPRGGYSSECQEKPGFRCDASTSPVRPEKGVFWTAAIAGTALALRLRRRREDLARNGV